MIRALYSAGSGMTAQQMNVDNIANNLANANTVGFKMRPAQVQDLMYQTFVQPVGTWFLSGSAAERGIGLHEGWHLSPEPRRTGRDWGW